MHRAGLQIDDTPPPPLPLLHLHYPFIIILFKISSLVIQHSTFELNTGTNPTKPCDFRKKSLQAQLWRMSSAALDLKIPQTLLLLFHRISSILKITFITTCLLVAELGGPCLRPLPSVRLALAQPVHTPPTGTKRAELPASWRWEFSPPVCLVVWANPCTEPFSEQYRAKSPLSCVRFWGVFCLTF